MPEPQTFWNGEPARARRCVVLVPAWRGEPEHPAIAWWKQFAGQTREAVEVEYAGSSFYLDDEGYEASAEQIDYETAMHANASPELKRLLPTAPRVDHGFPGWGWQKVTAGMGSPRFGHASLPRDVEVLRYREGCEGCGERRRASHAPGCSVRAGELARSGAFDD